MRQKEDVKYEKRPIFNARIVELIRVEVTSGRGTTESPETKVAQYWTKDGKLLCIKNAYEEEINSMW